MLRRALSLVFWLFLAASSIVLFPVAVLIWAVTAPFDRRGALLHRFTCFWASLYTWLNPAWRVRVEGRERIRPDAAYVMVANHQSLLDILVLFRLFVHFKWVSKIENFRVPFIGWNMALNRYIKLRRGSRESVAQALNACERALAQGSSIMMFPEGTRSPDGRLRAFKPGAFTLAQRTGAPILPIVIEGTASALPKRGFVLQGRHAIRVRVLDEIPHASFATEPVERVTAAVRERFVAAHGPRVAEDAPQLTADTRRTLTNAYSVSKALSEQLAWRLAARYGLELTAVRPCAIYGAFDPNFTAVFRRLVGFPVTVMPALMHLPLVYAGDVAEAIARAVERPVSIGRAYNVTGDEATMWAFARAWREAGGRGGLVQLPLPVPWRRAYDITRAREDLGWRNRPFVEALRETFALERRAGSA